MRRFAGLVIAVAVVTLVASPAWAQRGRRGGPFGGRMPGLMLLNQKSVQEDLKLTEDQAKKVEEAATKMMEAFQGLRDLDEAERPKKLEELNKEGNKTV